MESAVTAASEKKSLQKRRTGVVVSSAMDKTIVVLVESRKQHPVYGKIVRQHKKLYAHDEENKAKIGDTVRIVETRPISRKKRWRLVEISKRHEVAE